VRNLRAARMALEAVCHCVVICVEQQASHDSVPSIGMLAYICHSIEHWWHLMAAGIAQFLDVLRHKDFREMCAVQMRRHPSTYQGDRHP